MGEALGGNKGLFSLPLPGPALGEVESSHPTPVSRETQLKGLQWRSGVGIGWPGDFLLSTFGPFLAREPLKSRVPEAISPSLQSCLPAGLSSDQSHPINLRIFGQSGVSLVCPSSWWQHAQATNHPTRAQSHRHFPGCRLYHAASGPAQLSLGTVPGWGGGGSVHFCCFYTSRCNMGAPLAQGKALMGIDRHSGKHVTHCTRVASPCLGTCNIAEFTPEHAPNIPHCSAHMWLLHTSDSQH